MPLFLQLVLGYSALVAGLIVTPTALVMAVVAPLSGWISDRFGARILSSLGLAINGVALAGLGGLTADSGYGDVVRWLLLLGFGQGLFQSPNNSSVMGGGAEGSAGHRLRASLPRCAASGRWSAWPSAPPSC